MKQTIKSFALKFDENGYPELSVLLERMTVEKLKLELLKIKKLQEKGKSVELLLAEKREKRSLDANAYMWVLLDKLAQKLNTTKEEIYLQKIREVGVFDYVLLREETSEKFITSWNQKGVGWHAEKFDGSKIDGCTRIRCYYGSSTYDSKEMSRLIETVVQDCKELGIETKTPDEIAHLVALMNEKEVSA